MLTDGFVKPFLVERAWPSSKLSMGVSSLFLRPHSRMALSTSPRAFHDSSPRRGANGAVSERQHPLGNIYEPQT